MLKIESPARLPQHHIVVDRLAVLAFPGPYLARQGVYNFHPPAARAELSYS